MSRSGALHASWQTCGSGLHDWERVSVIPQDGSRKHLSVRRERERGLVEWNGRKEEVKAKAGAAKGGDKRVRLRKRRRHSFRDHSISLTCNIKQSEMKQFMSKQKWESALRLRRFTSGRLRCPEPQLHQLIHRRCVMMQATAASSHSHSSSDGGISSRSRSRCDALC